MAGQRLSRSLNWASNNWRISSPRGTTTRRDVFTYAAQLGIDFTGKAQALQEALAPNYQEILDAYSRRRQPVTEQQEDERVLAPADLLDDDAAKGE